MPVRIVSLIDCSGSMRDLHGATIEAYNGFLFNLQKQPGEANIRLIQFDDRYEILYDSPLLKARTLTMADVVPRGSTALNDALGRTITELGIELSSLQPEERPERVILYIQTDGQENSSKNFTLDQVNGMITHQREKYNWNFIFAAANMDAQKVAESYGMLPQSAVRYHAGVRGMSNLSGMAANAVNFARSGPIGASYQFTQEERNAAMERDEQNTQNGTVGLNLVESTKQNS